MNERRKLIARSKQRILICLNGGAGLICGFGQRQKMQELTIRVLNYGGKTADTHMVPHHIGCKNFLAVLRQNFTNIRGCQRRSRLPWCAQGFKKTVGKKQRLHVVPCHPAQI